MDDASGREKGGSSLGKSPRAPTASKSKKGKKGQYRAPGIEHDAPKFIDSLNLKEKVNDRAGKSIHAVDVKVEELMREGPVSQTVTKSGNMIVVHPSAGSRAAVFLRAVCEEKARKAYTEIIFRKGGGQPFDTFKTGSAISLTTEANNEDSRHPNMVILLGQEAVVQEVEVEETKWVKWDDTSDVEQWIKTRLNEERWMRHYDSSHNILVLEGDFTFSFRLSDGLTSAAKMVSIYPYSKEYALRNFKYYIFHSGPDCRRGCKVMYGVDIRSMVGKMSYLKKFERIVVSFDSDGFFKDLHERDQFQAHRKLIDQIFQCGAEMYSKLEGEVHIVHRKANDIVSRYQLLDLASVRGLHLIETIEVAYFDNICIVHKFSSWKDKPKAMAEIKQRISRESHNLIPTAECSFCAPKSSMI